MDHDAVLLAFRTLGPLAIGMSRTGSLDIADMLARLGRDSEARTALESYVSEPVPKTHAAYRAEFLEQRGHADLVPLIRTHG